MENDWLTPEQVAEYLQISKKTVVRHCAAGRFTRVLDVGTAKQSSFRIHRECVEESLAVRPQETISRRGEQLLSQFGG